MRSKARLHAVLWPALALTLALAACVRPADKAAEACPAGSPPEFRVDFAAIPPARDDSLSTAELSREGDVAFGRVAVGLTVVRLTVKADFRVHNVPALTDGICAYPGAVAFHVAYAERVVHVARELADEPCLHREVLDHENRHVALDDRYFPAAVKALEAGLPARFGPGVAWAHDAEAADAQVRAHVEAILRQLVADLDASRRDEHRRQVDTPEEEARMLAACGGRLRQLHLAGN